MKKVLIVEDEFIEATNLERLLVKAGYEVAGIAKSVPVALAMLDQDSPDFVLVDIYLKGPQTGIELARSLRTRNIPFLFISANSDKVTLDAAKETRPSGFLVKPFRERDVLVMLEIALYQHSHGIEAMKQQQAATTGANAPARTNPQPLPNIVGQSSTLQQAMEHIRIVAPSSTSVLILGESGTGKEKMAETIHAMSPRSQYPLIKVNCAAMPVTLIESILFGHEKGAFTDAVAKTTGKFEQAEKGTLFLDEIGEMPPAVQAKLLRVLQEKEIERIGGKQTIQVDVRIVAATNRNLEQEVAAGRFRMDLYYRLNVFPIQVPALRHRQEDILLLADHFIQLFSRQEGKAPFTLSPTLADKLVNYHWPGNIRELENTMRRMVLLGPDQPETSIYFGIRSQPAEPAVAETSEIKSWMEYERAYILQALRKAQGKISGHQGAAELLQLAPSTLESKMKRLGIQKSDYIKPD
ncbi:sigma-54-dependent transcriptional regulator [Paraflavitalea pollutisoli]|uniref:sigma-54-dependent transcriptional regulator n=1 Tax=Paraflavitalea pollutisoli TaxID=3034143 RepID=UPI0023EB7F23|nr:sigma-54 dependent transcriptional regulator [Paraflavitalea sp. H1-2-19X]